MTVSDILGRVYDVQLIRDFKKVSDALKYGGYLKFVPALRAATPVGYVQMGDRKTVIRYARAAARVRPAPDGSVILDDYAAEPIRLTVKPAK